MSTPINHLSKTKMTSLISLFTSASTLICCAIPSLLVALGAGAALSSVISAVPQLVWFSVHKIAIFTVAGVMLAASGYMQWYASKLPCPVDINLARVCNEARSMSRKIYYFSIAIYLIGIFFAFIAPLLNAR
jgi:hypothetical protein